MKFNKLVGVFFCVVTFVLFFPGMAPSADEKYEGVKKCKICHMKQFNTWKKSPKATTFKKLGDKHYEKDCQKCHATINNKTGEMIEENVTCEACHGPGGEHIKTKDLKKKPEGQKNIIRKPVNCADCHKMHEPHKDKKK